MNKINNRIFIVGFMGCGKTTIADNLQQHLTNYTFVDTDLVIEQINNATITQLFAAKGESFFRNEENKLINTLTTNNTPIIVATGGGLPLHNNLMQTLRANGTVVYLQLSPKILVQRLLTQKKMRPLISNVSNEELLSYITTLLQERAPTYAQAHYTINAEESQNKIVLKLMDIIRG